MPWTKIEKQMSSRLLSALQPTLVFSTLFSFYAVLTIPGNRSKSYETEQKIRARLVRDGREEDVEQYLAATLEWRKGSLLTHLGSPPPMPVILDKEIDFKR